MMLGGCGGSRSFVCRGWLMENNVALLNLLVFCCQVTLVTSHLVLRILQLVYRLLHCVTTLTLRGASIRIFSAHEIG
jgi:hypothetical protein